MPLVPRRQFGQEAAHGEGEGVAEQGLHLLEKAVAQEEPGGEEPPGQALAPPGLLHKEGAEVGGEVRPVVEVLGEEPQPEDVALFSQIAKEVSP